MSTPEPAHTPLSTAQRLFLKELAKQTVAAAVNETPAPDQLALAAEHGLDLKSGLMDHRGAFVTLTRRNQLRGCIGYIEGIKPLVDAVMDNARSAALNDPRFMAVTPAELPGLDLEISALTPLRDVAGHQNIQIGRHGILLNKNGRRSVFLPQVAPEQGWDLPTTLTQLALKAGLAADAWRQDTQFQVFEAEVF